MRHTLLIFFACLTWVFPTRSRANAELSLGRCTYVYRVGLVFNEPLYFVSGRHKLRGSSLEVIKELRKRTGCDFTVEEFSRPSLIDRFRRQQIDMSIISIKTSVMDDAADFIHLYNSPRGLIMKANTGLTLKAALKNQKIIFGNIMGTQNYYTTDEISFLRKEKRLIEYPDYNALFGALHREKIQAFLGSLMISSYYMNKLGLSDYSLVDDELFLIPVGYYVNKTRLKKAELLVLNKALNEMLKDGTFHKIYTEYATEDVAKRSILLIGQ